MLDEKTIADFDHTVPDLAHGNAHPVLRVLTGMDAGRSIRLDQDQQDLGRAEDAEIVISDEGVSRRHCQFVLGGDRRPRLRDLGSTNGTRVNGERIDKALVTLSDGDHIQLGTSVVLKFTWQGPLEEALENELYQSAVSDPLTGAYNRRYLLDRFGQEFTWAHRHGRPLGLAVIDLDHFKQVNDRFGHDAGDAVLRRVAEAIRKEIRHEDLLARYGGEEFVLLMRETTPDQAQMVAERIRHQVQDLTIAYGEQAIHITISIGLASSTESGITTPLDLFVRADKLLYVAKTHGRNRVATRPPAGPGSAQG